MKAIHIRSHALHIPLATALVLILAACRPAASQQLSTSDFVGAGTGAWVYGAWDSNTTGASTTHSDSLSFTGLDSGGATQTMGFTGTAQSSAEYGQLHAYATGQVTHTYYSASNPLYFDGSNYDANGSPILMLVSAQAGFSDTFTYTGFQGTGYKVNYYFHADGSVTNPDHSYAFFTFTASDTADTEVFFTSDTSADWTSQSHDVTWGTPFDTHSQFGAVFGVNTTMTPEHVDVSGTSDYSETLTLAGIQILDPNNNPLSGWYFTSASGTHYNLLGGTYGDAPAPASVPEPGPSAMLAGLGASFVGMGCWRRRMRRERSAAASIDAR